MIKTAGNLESNESEDTYQNPGDNNKIKEN